MKLKLTAKQMRMLLDKVGVPKGKIISTTGAVLNKILLESQNKINYKINNLGF
ncbi:hypothetical protein EYY60_07650 [Flavobacterium zhairuonense]|uniref:hypothetical protein n=1 Tax=Flavobacterium TaxID=237 RepID=UPI0013C2B526|nr:hypothetical protein [Flavobacterium zhairuonense]KAF2512114.1 hypothetical protein EYY60_07650 [Flavobacterium zhairuonense]